MASNERVYFESLESAIAFWGKWSGESWRIEEALHALDQVIAIKGPPSVASNAARLPAGVNVTRILGHLITRETV